MKILTKKWGFRGMDFKKASKVKKAGHTTEDIFAFLINVPKKNIVKGTGKTDVTNKDGKRVSLKSSSDIKGRSQICLYSYSSKYFSDTVNGSTKRMRACLAVFPDSSGEYKSKRLLVKKLLQPQMIELKNYINANK
ncbi:MAG: hypothetical protein Q8N88_01350, partial [Nanoarchaeota archaeon]|nr:hypothetical protein [Nanoarchaeota archaeon]